ncbi:MULTISPECIES: hypothetical protein [Aeromonas]|uniref:hypothetical protein n=1 Tax=Aeromonas TaxID=642 RepID=UPI0012F2647C|nr:hypothetical protein [Aeromonas salmonicida]VXA80905.1 hypothetical protein AERO9A_420300 [Aeromonas salmonicida]
MLSYVPGRHAVRLNLNMTPGGERGAIIVEQNKQARHAGCHRHRPIYVAGKMKKALYLPCYSQGNTGL